jgi:hypothetical protein
MSASLKDLVQELADREQIRSLPLRYCDCVWRDDMDGLLALFVDEGSIGSRGENGERRAEGMEELKRLYKERSTAAGPRPFIHNHVVDLLNGDRARGRCYVEIRNAAREYSWMGTACYHDEYIKFRGEWKFMSRQIEEFRMIR